MLQFPPSKQQPVDVFGKVIDIPQQVITRRFTFSAPGGIASGEIKIFTCPAGFIFVVTDLYRLNCGFALNSYIIFRNSSGVEWARIGMGNTVATVYGSVNYINGFPITLDEGDTVNFNYDHTDGGANFSGSLYGIQREKKY